MRRSHIAFPDLVAYSYIKKIEPQNKFGTKRGPQNKFGTKRGPQNKFGTKRGPQNKFGTIIICTSFNFFIREGSGWRKCPLWWPHPHAN